MPERFLDPAGLARIGNLELVAHQVVDGFLTGRHRSPYHGFSVEYLDHRAYVSGDDLHSLDWRLLARTDRYFVKLFEDETNLRAHILLDASRSMASAPGAAGGLCKYDYGAYLTAALTHLMLRQNDAVGLAVCDRTVRDFIPARARPTQFRQVLETLEHFRPSAAGDTDLGAVLHSVAERIRRRGLVIVISDLLDDPERIANGLQHFRHNQHEVIVFHVLDGAELDFPFDRLTRFRDPEGAGHVTVHPARLRATYLERMNAWLERLRSDCCERRVSYVLANTREPYDRLLAEYLDRRARMG